MNKDCDMCTGLEAAKVIPDPTKKFVIGFAMGVQCMTNRNHHKVCPSCVEQIRLITLMLQLAQGGSCDGPDKA